MGQLGVQLAPWTDARQLVTLAGLRDLAAAQGYTDTSTWARRSGPIRPRPRACWPPPWCPPCGRDTAGTADGGAEAGARSVTIAW
jgi:hypothetical protein